MSRERRTLAARSLTTGSMLLAIFAGCTRPERIELHEARYSPMVEAGRMTTRSFVHPPPQITVDIITFNDPKRNNGHWLLEADDDSSAKPAATCVVTCAMSGQIEVERSDQPFTVDVQSAESGALVRILHNGDVIFALRSQPTPYGGFEPVPVTGTQP